MYHRSGARSDTLLHYSRDALSGTLRVSNHVISQAILGKFKPDVTCRGHLSKDSLPACPRDDSPHPRRSRKVFMSPKAKAMYAPPDDIDHWAEPPEDGVEDVGVGLASGQVGGEGVEVSNLDDH